MPLLIFSDRSDNDDFIRSPSIIRVVAFWTQPLVLNQPASPIRGGVSANAGMPKPGNSATEDKLPHFCLVSAYYIINASVAWLSLPWVSPGWDFMSIGRLGWTCLNSASLISRRFPGAPHSTVLQDGWWIALVVSMNRSGRQLGLPDSESIEAGSHGAAEVEEPGRTTVRESSRHLGPGSIDILDFGFQWGIPSVDPIRVGVASTSETSAVDGVRVAYTVGAGHTATAIRHQTGDEESGILPQGTTIALKIFKQSPVPESPDGQHDQRSTLSQTYTAILGELGVFCHPELSEHPNFVKLLFLGWRSPNPFPILGMELGEYGSLDYILCAPGAGLSKAQKAHITMDIAAGLHALHSKGLVHGDLKPGNIVVFKHPDPERPLIAKLTDFGGASRRDAAPGFTTSLWSAPEVLHGDPDIEWDKCDIYSYAWLSQASGVPRNI